MTAPHPRTHRHQDDPISDNIIDAEPDPVAIEVAHLLRRAAAHAAIARAQQRFATTEAAYGQELNDDGMDDDGDAVTSDAIHLMDDAEHFLEQALAEKHEARALLEKRRREVSLALREMPNQNLLTLRDSVESVRQYIEGMSESDVRTIIEQSHQSENIIQHERDVAVTTGQHIEIILINIEEVRRDPNTLGKQLMTFITLALGFANYLPKLMELVNQLGRVLQQFHP